MKNLLIIIGLGLALNCSGQYSKQYTPPEGWTLTGLRVAGGTLVTTYIVVSEIPNTTYGERTAMAFTGMLASYVLPKALRYIKKQELFKNNNFCFLKRKHNNKYKT